MLRRRNSRDGLINRALVEKPAIYSGFSTSVGWGRIVGTGHAEMVDEKRSRVGDSFVATWQRQSPAPVGNRGPLALMA